MRSVEVIANRHPGNGIRVSALFDEVGFRGALVEHLGTPSDEIRDEGTR